MTRPSIQSEEHGHLSAEYTLSPGNPDSELVCALCNNVRMGPLLDTETTNLEGSLSIEVLVPWKNLTNKSSIIQFWPTKLLHLVLELEVRVEECSVHASKAASFHFTLISLCFQSPSESSIRMIVLLRCSSH